MNADASVPAAAGGNISVVGIGASAGGVDAFHRFFASMPAQSGLGFVVILHLAADRASLLREILGKWTSMPVSNAEDGMLVEPDHVYVVPPSAVLRIEAGRLFLRPSSAGADLHPIDAFFSSLAEDLRERAIGVILSGTGSDGALGLKAIKRNGGLTIAQGSNGTRPQFDGMPSAAVAIGGVDLVIPVEHIAERILGFLHANRIGAANRSDDADDDGDTTATNTEAGAARQGDIVPSSEANAPGRSAATSEIAAVRKQICDILQAQIGHDFSRYKEPTFLRRVQRRLAVVGLGANDYVDLLRRDHGEVQLLFRDLLIGVTSFFRDTETFEAVQRVVLPKLFAGKAREDTVRIWVPGCSTGEEAYSLAILLREHMDAIAAPPRVLIFATDIDEPAIAVARAGRYPKALLKGMPEARLQRFFSSSDSSYVVSKEVRELCTFSAHSVIRNPPFSRIDLISCRNLLIYLGAELQSRIIPAFHYSLVPGGYLLLGASETVARHEDLFAVVDKEHRIFQRRDTPSPTLHVTSLGATLRAPPGVGDPARERDLATGRAVTIASTRVLERYGPSFVVVDAQGDALHFSARIDRYLKASGGPPTRDVVAMARRGLRAELRTALRRCIDTGRTVERPNLSVVGDGGTRFVTLSVEPISRATNLREGGGHYLVVFTEAGAPPQRREEHEEAAGSQDASIAQLEAELRDTREQLQSTSEEYETAVEELKSANEELHSVNEELQSTNEELETSKEEMQSMNEELQTVNAQITAKIDEIDRANTDLRNLFDSTQVATIFLDRHLIIRGFTPAVAGIYNLIPSDHGRPITDIASTLLYRQLRQDCETVLSDLRPLERRVERQDRAAHYLMRILPYRTTDNAVDGILVTFVDVTSMVQAEQHQRLLVDELNHRVKNMLTVVLSLAGQTLRRTRNPDEFMSAFLGRVNALAKAYTILSRENWTEIPMRDVLEEELSPFTGKESSIVLSGPTVFLTPRGALSLGMAVHELVTNAVKYGALSQPGGKVSVHWRLDSLEEKDRLVLHWSESGGPVVTPPDHRGLGMTLIERSLRHELNGDAQLHFGPDGVHAELLIPIDPTVTGTTALPGRPAANRPGRASQGGTAPDASQSAGTSRDQATR